MPRFPATQSQAHADAALERSFRAGDRQAFTELLTRHQSSLFGFLGRMGVDQSTAEDLAQEACLRAWRAHDRFDPERARFSTWLFSIARRLTLNELDRQRRRVGARLDPEELVSTGAGPEGTQQQREQREQVQHALRTLSDADREVIALAFTQDLSALDASRILGCADGAYRTRLSRARQRLATALRREEAVAAAPNPTPPESSHDEA